MSATSNENFVRSEKTLTFQVGGTDKTRGPRESLYDHLNSPDNVLDQLANAVWRFDTALRSKPSSDWSAPLFHPDPYDASCPTVQTADRLRVMRDRLTAPKHRWRIHREDFDDWWDRRNNWQASIDSGTYTEDMVFEQMAALESCLDEYRGGGSVTTAELETIGKQLRQLRQSLAEPSSPQWTATSVLSAITGTALTAYLGYRAYTWMTGDEWLRLLLEVCMRFRVMKGFPVLYCNMCPTCSGTISIPYRAVIDVFLGCYRCNTRFSRLRNQYKCRSKAP